MLFHFLFFLLALTAPFAIHSFPIDSTKSLLYTREGKWFNRIVIINFENTNYEDALKDPYLNKLSKSGVLLSNYFAITHPSQPNYVAQTYGSTFNIKDDRVHNISGDSVVDLLERKNVTWKGYMENYKGNCNLSEHNNGLYVRKHNPLISFEHVQNNPSWCAKIVPAEQLDKDISSETVPQFVYFTPNMNNDGHDTSVPYLSAWLERFLTPRMKNEHFIKDTLIVITFDEQESYTGDNKVYTVLLGPAVDKRVGEVDREKYNHYSLLKTVENNWDLGGLGRNDVNAEAFKL